MSIESRRLIVGEGGQVTFRVSRPAGTPLRILILDNPKGIDPAQNTGQSQNLDLTDAERFQLGALASVTDDDPAEDAIWERYLHG